jgi:hypothetical protein
MRKVMPEENQGTKNKLPLFSLKEPLIKANKGREYDLYMRNFNTFSCR